MIAQLLVKLLFKLIGSHEQLNSCASGNERGKQGPAYCAESLRAVRRGCSEIPAVIEVAVEKLFKVFISSLLILFNKSKLLLRIPFGRARQHCEASKAAVIPSA